MTERDRVKVSWVALLVGVLLTAVGLLGIWMQGLFYRAGFPMAATFGEVRNAFTLPAAVTALGSMVVVGVVFGSAITASWSSRRKLVVFAAFGVLVMVGCVVCGHLAAARVANILN